MNKESNFFIFSLFITLLSISLYLVFIPTLKYNNIEIDLVYYQMMPIILFNLITGYIFRDLKLVWNKKLFTRLITIAMPIFIIFSILNSFWYYCKVLDKSISYIQFIEMKTSFNLILSSSILSTSLLVMIVYVTIEKLIKDKNVYKG